MKAKATKKYLIIIAILTAAATALALTSCNSGGSSSSSGASSSSSQSASQDETKAETTAAATTSAASKKLAESDIKINDTIENSADGEHAITADGETKTISNTLVTKTGEADGDEADFYGENSAIFATNGGTLNLSDMVVKTDGTHANAVFSYGEGTTVNISNSYIETSGNCSGGLMTTGGGTVTVTGGDYTTSGKGSPVIYSTADITVNDATMTSTASQGVVVEGKNSVTLNNVNLTADNNTKNSDKSSYYQAVMIYQSMSGDAAQGKSSFTMNGGTLTNKNGDVFFVNNTATDINLSNAEIINNGDGIFLRAAAAGWGSEGSNGGQVTLNAANQTINGDMIVDSVSNLNLYLKSGSAFTGAINSDGQAGEVYVEIEDGSTWTLTGDSYITSLTCGTGAIKLNGHKLYVNGKEYTEGTASTGTAVEVKSTGGSGAPDSPPDGKPGENGGSGGTPPAKPGEN